MRIQGRTLRPSNLAERRLLLSSLGTQTLRVPRKTNPYLIARRLERAAKGNHPDILFVCVVLNRTHTRTRDEEELAQTETAHAQATD